MSQRNRESGWKHAKLSGHTNEEFVKNLLDMDKNYRKDFMKRIHFADEVIEDISIGGLREKNVPSVLGKKTKNKTDLILVCKSGKTITISIKKSLGGQVYLVRAGLFIEIYEKQFGEKIPANVQRAINLFWSATDDAKEIISKYADKSDTKSYNLQMRHNSLNASTLKSYNKELYDALLNWFRKSAYNLTKLAFSMGAVKNSEEWSEYVWYVNLLGENKTDAIFYIKDLCNAAKKFSAGTTYYGTTNGGTTIQLPFGFVQWHQKQLQFHHSFDKISSLLNP